MIIPHNELAFQKHHPNYHVPKKIYLYNLITIKLYVFFLSFENFFKDKEKLNNLLNSEEVFVNPSKSSTLMQPDQVHKRFSEIRQNK